MEKNYDIGGETVHFINVEMSTGHLFGFCKAKNKYAWLYPDMVQFEGLGLVHATETQPQAFIVPPGYHFWGGQLRNNAQWRTQR